MKIKILTLVVIGSLFLVSTTVVLGTGTEANKKEVNNGEWKSISINGKFEGFICGTLIHFFGFWCTSQPMGFYKVTEDSEIKINGEIVNLEGVSDISLKGFVGKSVWPLQDYVREKQGLEYPWKFSVSGLTRNIEIYLSN